MGGDNVDAAADCPMGHRDAKFHGNGQGRGDARHQCVGDARSGQSQRLLSASAKDEGVAALEPDDTFPFPCLLNEQLIDVLLFG